MKLPRFITLICITLASNFARADDISASTWQGIIGKNIPVRIELNHNSHVAKGTIRYLNTVKKTPITLIGTIEKNHQIRLNEFDSKGNISGVLEGILKDKNFNGTWHATKNNKELEFHLKAKTTLTPVQSFILPRRALVDGEYFYQYGENGYQGSLNIKQISSTHSEFNINSVTHAPSRNIADISDHITTPKQHHFIYKIPNDTANHDDFNCEFKTDFYDGFAIVAYTSERNARCPFGFNATVEGVFLKLMH